MQNKGQGAIEYLLIIGAAILVVAVVIIGLGGILTQGKNVNDMNEAQKTNNPLYEQLATAKGEYFIPAGVTKYYTYNGDTPTTLLAIAATGTNLKVCWRPNVCNVNYPVDKGSTVAISGLDSKKTFVVKTNLGLIAADDVSLWAEDSTGLKWSPGFGVLPWSENTEQVCANITQGARVPTDTELINALEEQFSGGNTSLNFVYNYDYWSKSDTCEPNQGMLIWWSEGSWSGGSCWNNQEGVNADTRCVYKNQ